MTEIGGVFAAGLGAVGFAAASAADDGGELFDDFVGFDSFADEVIAHCRSKLPRYKVVKTVQMVDSLPKTSSGKIRRFELRDQYLKSQDVN